MVGEVEATVVATLAGAITLAAGTADDEVAVLVVVADAAAG